MFCAGKRQPALNSDGSRAGLKSIHNHFVLGIKDVAPACITQTGATFLIGILGMKGFSGWILLIFKGFHPACQKKLFGADTFAAGVFLV